MFKRRRFPVEIILLCVRWYCKYGISYRDLVEMMQERGVEVDPSTIMRWVHRYAPELEKRVRWYQGYRANSWRVDETYVKVGGRWKYLFRAVDKHGRLIDFMLADRRAGPDGMLHANCPANRTMLPATREARFSPNRQCAHRGRFFVN
jgi:transposase-like protein